MVGYLIEREIMVRAPASLVWEELVMVKDWPAWKPMIKSINFRGERLMRDSRFTMWIRVKGPAIPVPVKMVEFEEGKQIAWTGGLPGASMSVHSFILEESGESTRVISREEFTGALVGLMKVVVSEADLFRLHDDWLGAIKSRVEG